MIPPMGTTGSKTILYLYTILHESAAKPRKGGLLNLTYYITVRHELKQPNPGLITIDLAGLLFSGCFVFALLRTSYHRNYHRCVTWFIEVEAHLTWNRKMISLLEEAIHFAKTHPDRRKPEDGKVRAFRKKYLAILNLARSEYGRVISSRIRCTDTLLLMNPGTNDYFPVKILSFTFFATSFWYSNITRK